MVRDRNLGQMIDYNIVQNCISHVFRIDEYTVLVGSFTNMVSFVRRIMFVMSEKKTYHRPANCLTRAKLNLKTCLIIETFQRFPYFFLYSHISVILCCIMTKLVFLPLQKSLLIPHLIWVTFIAVPGLCYMQICLLATTLDLIG